MTDTSKMTFGGYIAAMADIDRRLREGDETLQLEEADTNEKGGLTPDAVRKVYHRDYLKTKDKPYRKYNKAKRAKQRAKKK